MAIALLEQESIVSNDETLFNNLTIIKGRYNSLIQNNIRGLISYEEYSKELANVNNSILLVIEKIPNAQSLDKEKKVLFIYSNPNEKYNLGFEKEVQEIRNALAKGKNGSSFGLIVEASVNFEDIEGLVERYNPVIVHFCIWSLKNNGQGLFLFEGTQGSEVQVSLEEFRGSFENIKKINDSIETVVLNTCFSQKYGEEISSQVDYVIAMNDLVEDEYFPFEFSRLFYTNIFNGIDVYNSFQKTVLRLKSNTELKKYNFIEKEPYEIPVLFQKQ